MKENFIDINSPNNVFAIAGMHRSGTSLTASLMKSSGVNIGERLLGVDVGNLKGHFENLDFVDFHRHLLESLGLSPDGWVSQKGEFIVPEQFREQAKIVLEKQSKSSLWGWKDPRTTLFLDFWHDLLPNAYFIFIYRKPWEVLDSLYRRGDETFFKKPRQAIEVWIYYNKLILDFYRRFPEKSLLINIDSLIEDCNCISKLCADKFNINLDAPDKNIIDKSLISNLSSQATYRHFLAHKLFPEALNLFNDLTEQADIKYPTIVLEDVESDASFKDWVLEDWAKSSSTNRISQQLQQTRSQLQQTQSQLQQTRSQLQQTQSQLQQTQSQLQQTQVEIQNAASIISGMESSKFWKLRNTWFFLKERFFLTQGTEYLYRIIIKLYLIYKIPKIWKERGTQGLIKFLYSKIRNKVEGQISYQDWIARNELQLNDVLLVKEIESFKYLPKFSVIIPVYNVDEKWLRRAIDSVCNQIYKNWEVCLVDDASTKYHIKPILTQYSQKDTRIKVVFREENGNISAASNSALEIATGDYIALLDNDDELAINALFENAKLINQHPDADFIYSDEDKMDVTGQRMDPFFKPDWSPDYFHACMYTCHLGVYRTSLIREIGGFRSEYDGSQDYDLVLRVVEKTKNIYHIPKILYHWRIIPASAASGAQAKPWAYTAAKKALEDMLQRSPYTGNVEKVSEVGVWRVRRDIIGQPLVSIIIPSAGKMCNSLRSHLERCVVSVQNLSQYRNFEIVLVDGYDINDEILEKISAPNIKLVRCREKFNYSMRINRGTKAAEGDLLLLLNDDTEVINPDWLESMIEFAQQPEVGAVGAKLFYPDGNLQHTGVLIFEGKEHLRPVHSFYNQPGDHPGYFHSNIVSRNYLAVTGACLMVRKSVFHEVGEMDEDLPLNFNDVDFCLKLHQAGYRNVFTPYTQLMHYESATRKPEVKAEEIKMFNDKWEAYLESLGGDPYYNKNLSTDSVNFEIKASI